MNATELLAMYERVADAPDAVAKLRRFVLDLAVRGRLHASGLQGWRRFTLGDLGAWGSGGTPLKGHPEYYGGGIPWLVIGDLNDSIVDRSAATLTEAGLLNSSAKLVEPGALLIAMYGSIGKLGITGIRCATNQAIAHCVPDATRVSVEFLFLLVKSLRTKLLSEGQGVAQQNISQRILKAVEVLIPPLAEQHRIVAKVDELMALCDQLEAARTGREAARDRLATASFARLNAPDPDTFQSDARFALNVLPALSMRPDQVKQLRQTILNLAVRGKLVSQDPTDESAAVLLGRTASEIASQAQHVRSKAPQLLPVSAIEMTFSAPPRWQWARLSDVFVVIADGDHQPPPQAESGVAFLTIENVTTGRIDFANCRLVPRSYFERLSASRTPQLGDILYTVVGATYGRAIFVETDREFCVQRHIAIMRPSGMMNSQFLVMLLRSPFVYGQASAATTGTAQPTIGLGPLRKIAVCVPPLAEQHRIVAKVDELMALCDELESSLMAGESTRSRLLDALLHEALEPVINVAA